MLDRSGKPAADRSPRLLVVAVALVLAMQAHLALAQEINWDEFFYLSHVYEYQRGTLSRALQTIHVHLFGWLTAVPGHEIRQIEAGRLVMLALEAGTCAGIYVLARNFVSRSGAALAALAYASAGFVIVHGASFRADPLAAFLMTTSLALLASSALRARDLVALAALTALAGMVTVKVAFYGPAIIGVALWKVFTAPQRFAVALRLGAAGVGALVLFALMYLVHQAVLPSADLGGSETMMRSAAATTVFAGDFFPRWDYFSRGALAAPAASILLAAGATVLAVDAIRRRVSGWDALALFALFAPLLSFLFYRNAFPYYFAFILPPAMVLVGVATDRLKLSRLLLLAVAGSMVASGAVAYAKALTNDQRSQDEIVEVVHAMLAEPVAYVDRNSMIGSFFKRGFFMSTWGLRSYQTDGRPVFAEILAREPVPLLILNGPSLAEAVGEPILIPPEMRLLDADRQTLRANYIPHWGKVWVAGQAHTVGPEGIDIVIAVPGRYTLEASAKVAVDGVATSPGSSLVLSRGDHRLVAATEQTVTLRWGEGLYRPAAMPSQTPVYRGF